MRKLTGTLLLAGALFASGCDNTVENAPGPTTPAPTVTDTFSGTLAVNGGVTHTFAVAGSGTVTATINEVTPDSTTALGFALGTWNGTSCQAVIAREDAVQGQSIVGNVTGVGTLCLRLNDPNGKLTASVNYRLSVEHP